MAARRKCVICNEPIVDEDGVPYKGHYAHKKCFNIAIKTLQKEKTEQIDKVATKKKVGRKARPQAELKEALSEEEYAKKQQYYKYLRTKIQWEFIFCIAIVDRPRAQTILLVHQMNPRIAIHDYSSICVVQGMSFIIK